MLRLTVLLVFQLAVTLLLDAFEQLERDCGRSVDPNRLTPPPTMPIGGYGHRVVGGNESMPHYWPWTAQLIYSETKIHRCGATIINFESVITAAHCFSRSRNPKRYSVLIGGHKLGTGKRIEVRNISIHPLYNIIMPSAFDVAVVRLFERIPFNRNVRAICLPNFEPSLEADCIVAGWGFQTESGEYSPALRQIRVPLVPTMVCNGVLHYFGRVDPVSMLCAGAGGADACQGDSGGPLMCFNRITMRWELQGVVSWGHGCGRSNSPGVYAKIAAVSTWAIQQTHVLRLNDP